MSNFLDITRTEFFDYSRQRKLIRSAGKMKSRIFAGVIAHTIVCALYVVTNYCAISLYRYFFDGMTSRGVAIGMAMYLVFYFFISMNLLMALIPNTKAKLSLVALMVAIITMYLLPEHPLRAMFYSTLSGTLSLIAIYTGSKLESLLEKSRKQINTKQQSL